MVDPTVTLLPSEVRGTAPEHAVPPTDQLAVPEAQELGGGGGGVVQEAPKGPLHEPELQLKVAEPMFPLVDVTLNEPPLLTAPAAPEQLLPPTDQLRVPPEHPGTAGAAQEADDGPIHDPAEQLNDADPLLPLLDVTTTEPPLATDEAVPEQLSAPTDHPSVPPLQPPGTQLGFDVDQDPAVQVAVTLPLYPGVDVPTICDAPLARLGRGNVQAPTTAVPDEQPEALQLTLGEAHAPLLQTALYDPL